MTRPDARQAAMALPREKVVELIGSLPAGAFGTDKTAIRARVRNPARGLPACVACKADWVLFVAEANTVDGEEAPLFLCTAVARLMAEAVGAVRPIDYSDASMREMLLAALKPGAKPFAEDRPAEWRDFAIKPCHVNMALRAQSKACSTFGPQAPAPTARARARVGARRGARAGSNRPRRRRPPSPRRRRHVSRQPWKIT